MQPYNATMPTGAPQQTQSGQPMSPLPPPPNLGMRAPMGRPNGQPMAGMDPNAMRQMAMMQLLGGGQ